MSTYNVVDAKNKLSELINRALRGETVTITRHGRPVVELKPVASARRPVMTEADLEWLRARRARMTPSQIDAGTFVSQMRDEEWER
jgi:prevent-host-death family protein